MGNTPRRIAGVLAAVLGLFAAATASAETRAWLDRDRIVLGESATLNIETDQATVPAPDYAALRRDFGLDGHTSRRSLERVNGRSVSRSLFSVQVEPRRTGVVRIPALSVGRERTAPLALTVLPASAAPTPANAGDTVFIETSVDDTAPYVQQSVGVLVRLHHAVPWCPASSTCNRRTARRCGASETTCSSRASSPAVVTACSSVASS